MRKVIVFLFFISIYLNAQNQPIIIVLGNVQDGGLPHIGCSKKCCMNSSEKDYRVTSIGLNLSENKGFYLFDASPDFSDQIMMMDKYNSSLNGIFITHAHIGHYTGLMYLGKEALGSKNVKVFAMPRMSGFLEQNGPWEQLVSESNIIINRLENKKPVKLDNNLIVEPIIVPHRDEYSETVGYFINGPNKRVFYLPDIDKWEKWSISLIDVIKDSDLLFLDATFYDNSDSTINHRSIQEIPHPFVVETLNLLKSLTIKEKKKIYFIHMNHTNPMLDINSDVSSIILKQGYNIARIGQVFEL